MLLCKLIRYWTTGRHHIRYAIFPHSGPLGSNTIRKARNFNTPLQIHTFSSSTSTEGFRRKRELFSSISLAGSSSLVLDTIKRGEDDEDVSRGELPKRKGRSLIVRIYESLGGRARGSLSFYPLPINSVWKTNLLEDDEEELKFQSGRVEVQLRAFEVATFRLQL